MTLEKLSKRLYSKLKRASLDHALVEPDDHILVCLSGGKDSYTMLAMLREMQRRVPFSFELTAFHLDQNQPGYPVGIMEDYLRAADVAHEVVSEDTYSVVTEKLAPEATPCSLCSRLRRGIIYTRAKAHGCNKIALGHHRDDSIETLLMNMFHTGQMQAMPAKYTTDDGTLEVIRPLIYCAEADIEQYSQLAGFPIIPCNLCGSHEGQRRFVKQLLSQLEETIPQVRNSMLAATQNVRATHLLDVSLLERLGLREVDEGEDDIARLVTNRPASAE